MTPASGDRRWQRRVAVLIPPLVVAVFAVVLYRYVERRHAANAWVEHTYRVIGGLDELRARLIDAETGQRGYVITGDSTYLEPYRDADRDAQRMLAQLRVETRDNPAQQRMIDSIGVLVRQRMEIMERPLRIARTQGLAAARETLTTGGGKATMDRIRAAVATTRAEERRLLAARDSTQTADERALLWVLFLGGAAVAAMAGLTGGLFSRDARVQRALNADLRGANAQLQDQAMELEAQTDELQMQATQLQETMVELESSNEELQEQRAELEELNEALEARTAEAESANRAKTEFLTSMSHELRTPLNAIAGYADLLEMEVQGPLTPEQRRSLARIRFNEQHLLGLINDVLNFARLEAGKLELRISEVPVGTLLEEIDGVVEPLVAAKGLSYAADPADPELRLTGDRDRVAQILLNLLSNAVKCTDAGGRLRMWADGDGDAVRIHVSDTGRGIAEDKLEAIFDPFVQLAPDRSIAQGVGLGLAISRELARAMQGELTVESTPGEGSTFTLTLPREPSPRA